MKTVKITSKGQITIPASIRRKLKSDVLEVSFDGERIILRPLKSLGGILREYAMKDRPIDEVMEMEKEAMW